MFKFVHFINIAINKAIACGACRFTVMGLSFERLCQKPLLFCMLPIKTNPLQLLFSPFSLSVFKYTYPEILCGSHGNLLSYLWTHPCELLILFSK